MTDLGAADLHSPRTRAAGKDLLSLALIDARNHSLRWMALHEAAPTGPGRQAALWECGHLGWYQERWIARNVQRQRGTRADPRSIRLASIEPQADAWYDPDSAVPEARGAMALPDFDATRRYLATTMDITLDLLESAHDGDEPLYFYRRALFHEDAHAESLAVLAQTHGLAVSPALNLLKPPAALAQRPPLVFPATRTMLGAAPGAGFVFDNEKWAHEVALPEFEIDAQAVTWAQYTEFVEDGGYDEPGWWAPEGWQWLQSTGRRVPQHVDQMRQGVLQHRFGSLARVPLAQAAVHVSWYEADAWCRWAGRRLPSEVEWESAARTGASRGFRWGDVWEWTGTTFRPYPGFEPDPDVAYSQPHFGTHRVLRGASFATPARLRHVAFRNFELPTFDAGFCGFRSCAV